MLAWLKPLGIAVGAFGVSWLGAIWYWRAGNREPAAEDLVLYLLVLPLALLLLFWLGKKLHTRLTTAAAAAAVTAPAVAAGTAPAAAKAPPALAIVAAAVRAPHGESAAELRAAMTDGAARPALDDQLYDDHGFPVMAARIADNDPAALREDLAPWLAARGSDEAAFSDEQWRALNAGHAVLAELAGWLVLHPQLHPQLDPHHARTDPRIASPLPMLRLLPVWPAGWTPQACLLADASLRHQLVQAGWPQERIAPAPAAGADANGMLAALLAEAAADPAAPLLALVLACDSHIGEAAVDALDGAGRLFSTRRPQGEIPGEGAAGLLLADPRQAALLAPDDDPVALHGAASARLDASADLNKRPDAALLRRMATALLEQAGATPQAVLALTTDADHRTTRVMEVMDLLAGQFGQLDAAADVASVAAACGSCGAVSYLTALVLARHEAQERPGPVLCVGNLDPYRRDIAYVAPFSLPVAPGAPAAPVAPVAQT